MAGATMAEIRAGLLANLDAVYGSTVQTSAYMLSNPTPPTIQVMGSDSVEYDQTMARGLDYWHLIVQGFVGAVADVGAQTNLDLWIAPSGVLSVKAAIQADRTLGGKVHDLTVDTCSGYRVYQLDAGGAVLGAEWTVLVLNAGT